MYQVTGNQVSFRINDALKQQLNILLSELQADGKHGFSSMKEFMEYAIPLLSSLSGGENIETNETTENPESENQTVTHETVEIVPMTPEVIEAIEKIRDGIGYETTPTIGQILVDCVEIALTPVPAPKPEKEIVEVEVEVEKALQDNQVIVNLAAEQRMLLVKVSRWRSLQKLDKVPMAEEEVLRNLAFQEGPLVNYFDVFQTGIRSSKINK